MRCFDWTSQDAYQLVALGYSSGRSLLGRLELDQENQYQLKFTSEFLPKHVRACTDIAFSHVNSSRLAIGFEKARQDFGLMIWDIESANSKGHFEIYNQESSQSLVPDQENKSAPGPGALARKPVVQYGLSETVSSMAWFHRTQDQMAVGMSQKWIRLFDLRGKNLASF